jgi:hypothetical protein
MYRQYPGSGEGSRGKGDPGVRAWTKPDGHGMRGGAVADMTRSKTELMLENALLRQQLMVLKRQVKRPRLSWRERGVLMS